MNRSCAAWWIAVLLAPIVLVLIHFKQMWAQSQYHYLPALAVAMIALFATRWDRQLQYPKSILITGLVWGTLATVLPLAYWVWSPWLATLGWIMLLGAFFTTHREAESNTSLVSLACLTPMMLPLPMHLDSSLTSWLQMKSTWLSSYLLDLFEVPHVLFGNVIETVGGKLFVEQACSGVQSLFTVVFCAILALVYFRRPIWLLPVYVIAGVLWAGVMNILRIMTIALAQSWYEVDLAHGWKHAVLGYVCLLLAILLLFSTDRLIQVLFFPTNPENKSSTLFNPLVHLWNKALDSKDLPISSNSSSVEKSSHWFSWVLVPLPVGLLLVSLVTAISRYQAGPGEKMQAANQFMEVSPEAALSDEFLIAEHKHVLGDVSQPFGEHGDIWQGQIGTLPATIVLSQPYPVWHDLCICYEANGWMLNERQVVTLNTTQGDPWDCVVARFIDPTGKFAYLWFSSFDSSGSTVDPPASSLWGRIGFSLNERKRKSLTDKLGIVQLFLETSNLLTPSEIENLERVHGASREVIISKLSSQELRAVSQ